MGAVAEAGSGAGGYTAAECPLPPAGARAQSLTRFPHAGPFSQEPPKEPDQMMLETTVMADYGRKDLSGVKCAPPTLSPLASTAGDA